jgi:hypothetical protein
MVMSGLALTAAPQKEQLYGQPRAPTMLACIRPFSGVRISGEVGPVDERQSVDIGGEPRRPLPGLACGDRADRRAGPHHARQFRAAAVVAKQRS